MRMVVQPVRAGFIVRGKCCRYSGGLALGAFSSEVETVSRKENASNQQSRASFRFYRNEALVPRRIPMSVQMVLLPVLVLVGFAFALLLWMATRRGQAL